MERAANVYVECVDFGWNDLGTWSSLYDNSPKNRDQNVTQNFAACWHTTRRATSLP